MGRIRKVLIANRGEIALRIIRACKEMNISTIAVYSSCDREGIWVREADEAYELGPPPPLESYLNIERIIELSKTSKADAIHPGYGFLAENPLFSKRCEDEGIIFIGPNSKALSLVGDKLKSRNTVAKIGVPVIPGMEKRVLEFRSFKSYADKIGYPVIIKASGGGGGKGMRIVKGEEELEESLESAKREARSSFGDETIYLEKYIEKPRHVEFQVLADNYGNAISLYERECSIQRRYQKIIEETPCRILTEERRREMGEAAVKVIKASGYNNAGTVEFLVDREGNFYFLEVNARLQVEHPITELVTGVDLVKEQIRIASGEKLSLKDISQRGHSIECRVYAEDPENNFLPSPGRILFLEEPRGPGIRVDSGIYSGWEVSPYYDPILSKIIVWASTREEAIKRMQNALSSYVILGIKTTIPFLKALIESEEFIKGNTHTHFIQENMKGWRGEPEEESIRLALVASAIDAMEKREKPLKVKKETYNPWLSLGRWELFYGT